MSRAETLANTLQGRLRQKSGVTAEVNGSLVVFKREEKTVFSYSVSSLEEPFSRILADCEGFLSDEGLI